MSNIEKIKVIYLIIPTINGEINGDPYITLSIDKVFFGEVTIYEININTLEVKEVE